MPRARFEPAIPLFERSKTVLALDHAAIGTGGNFTSEDKATATNCMGGQVGSIAPLDVEVMSKDPNSSRNRNPVAYLVTSPAHHLNINLRLTCSLRAVTAQSV
jgi:hypothetical protein